MTPEQLAVERDALLTGGRTLEEVEAMQMLSDPEWVRLLRLWGDNDEAQPAYDHACPKCVGPGGVVTWAKGGWLCLWHRARLTLSPPETRTGASAPRPSGEAP